MDLTGNGLARKAVSCVMGILLAVLAWVWVGTAEDVKLNTEHRISDGVTEEQVNAALKKQSTDICWLENSVRAIHSEQRTDRELLNRIARKMEVETAPPVRDLEKKEVID